MVDCGVVEYGVVEYGVVEYGVVEYGVVSCGVVEYGVVDCGGVEYGVVDCGVVSCNYLAGDSGLFLLEPFTQSLDLDLTEWIEIRHRPVWRLNSPRDWRSDIDPSPVERSEFHSVYDEALGRSADFALSRAHGILSLAPCLPRLLSSPVALEHQPWGAAWYRKVGWGMVVGGTDQ